jgi:hypothetical protein
MAVDVYTLPIPDWNLTCPQCGYRLNGLPEHRCPECGSRFDMRKVVKTWHRLRDPVFTGRELPLPDWGMRCRQCGYILTGASAYRCPECGTEFDPLNARPTGTWFALTPAMCEELAMPAVEVLLTSENIPFFADESRTVYEIVMGQRFLGYKLIVASEFYFDVAYIVRRAAEDVARARGEAGDEMWRCGKCQEENPPTFDVCWNCESPRPARGDRSADAS